LEEAGGNKKISWDVSPMPAGAVAEVSYIAFVRANDGVDKVIINRVTFTGTLGGRTVSDSTLAFVIVGNPTGQYPSSWPVAQGCITQGPNGSESHGGAEAVDIAPHDPGDPTSLAASAAVSATHDGIAYVGYNGTYGNYVEIVSPLGFRSRYGHLRTVSVTNGETIVPGQLLGKMGNTGSSSGIHLHYEFVGLEMDRPYIPLPADVDIRQCVGRDGCNNFCFGD
jgi:murein DD-endopeptidase MepM/ murein hydrolase activator NlpD